MRNDLRDVTPSDDQDEPVSPNLVRRLRVARQVSPSFEQRVMEAIHREAEAAEWPGGPRRPDSWWRRPHTFAVSPAQLVALAASVVIAIVASVAGARARIVTPGRPGGATQVAAAPTTGRLAPDTVYVIRFVYPAAQGKASAQQVSLVGDFNGWTKGATRLSPSGVPGVWTVAVTLPRGRHEYAFVVHATDGDHWYADPAAMPVHDEFGTETSVVIVGRGLAPYHS